MGMKYMRSWYGIEWDVGGKIISWVLKMARLRYDDDGSHMTEVSGEQDNWKRGDQETERPRFWKTFLHVYKTHHEL